VCCAGCHAGQLVQRAAAAAGPAGTLADHGTAARILADRLLQPTGEAGVCWADSLQLDTSISVTHSATRGYPGGRTLL
jgi:hypothetical protein